MSTNTVGEGYVSSITSIPGPLPAMDSNHDALFDSYPSGYASVSAKDGPSGEAAGTADVRTVIATPRTADGKDLHLLLDSEPGVQIIAECRDTELGAVIRRSSPHLVVLDIRSQDAKKAALVNQSLDADRPVFICVASDPQYATYAFEVQAVDFLLRPFDKVRFHQAMERARRELRNTQYSRLAQQMIGLLQHSRMQDQPEQLVFRTNGRLIFIDLNDIDWIGASANYVQVNAGAESYLVRESIGRLSARLDRERFVRIHRSVIVNVRRIKELQSCNAGEYIAVLKNGKKLPCSRGFRSELERYVSSCMRAANPDR